MKKKKDNKASIHKIIRQNVNKSYLLLIVLALLIVLIGYGILVLFKDYTPVDLLCDVVGNLIGVLVAFIFFDVINEKLTKDSYAEEISQKITDTLMGNPETLESFDPKQRKNFINNTITSLIDDEIAADMICNRLTEYLCDDADYKIRTEFDYDFVLSPCLPSNYPQHWNRDEYFYVQERLTYKIKYFNESQKDLISDNINIGFVFDNKSLDNVLREKKTDEAFKRCIFRESLDIDIKDIEPLKSDSVPYGQWDTSKETIQNFQKLFKLDLHIDNQHGEITGIKVLENGIVINIKIIPIQCDIHQIRIVFYMPKRWDTLLEVAIVDPTKGPKISVSYDENSMYVDMFSFLSKGEESSYEVAQEQINGNYNIILDKEWIYPISGLVFDIKKNN